MPSWRWLIRENVLAYYLSPSFALCQFIIQSSWAEETDASLMFAASEVRNADLHHVLSLDVKLLALVLSEMQNNIIIMLSYTEIVEPDANSAAS